MGARGEAPLLQNTRNKRWSEQVLTYGKEGILPIGVGKYCGKIENAQSELGRKTKKITKRRIGGLRHHNVPPQSANTMCKLKAPPEKKAKFTNCNTVLPNFSSTPHRPACILSKHQEQSIILHHIPPICGKPREILLY